MGGRFDKLRQALRQHPLLGLLALLIAGVVVWHLLQPDPVPGQRQPLIRTQAVQELPLKRDKQTGDLLEFQAKQARLEAALDERDRKVRAMEQAQQRSDQERQDRDAQVQQKMDALVKRTEEAERKMSQTLEAAKHSTRKAVTTTQERMKRTSTPTTPMGEHPAVVAPEKGGPMIRILGNKERTSFQGQPPSAARANTPELPEGSFARIRLITGGSVTSQVAGGWGAPILLSIIEPFHGPFHITGLGQPPKETEIPLQGCFAFGEAKADLSQQRVVVKVTRLSCVWPDESVFARDIRGYLVDSDGALGLRGQLDTHDSAKIGKAAIAAIFQEGAGLVKAARSNVLITGAGGPISGQGGADSLLQKIGDFYLDQAKMLLPTLWVPAKREGYLIIQEGVTLEDFPTTVTLTRRSLPE